MPVPDSRIHICNDKPLRPHGEYVLYWMIAARRTRCNFGLQRAVEQALDLGKPLVILESLRIDYPHASDRLHAFVLEGMADNARAIAGRSATYYPYVEPEPGAGRGLLAALGRHACAVVTDDSPAFFLPRMISAASQRLDVQLEAVDSNGLLPLHATERVFLTAFAFRRFLQSNLQTHLWAPPAEDPLRRATLPRLPGAPHTILERWPAAKAELLARGHAGLGALSIDHGVAPVSITPGGCRAAGAALARFVAERLDSYLEDRNHPDRDATSGLSAYLHFGHLSAHEILHAIAARERWTPARLKSTAAGKRSGWWHMRPPAEGFLDQLVTWRELGFNFAAHRSDTMRFDSLPAWAQATLARHAGDPRPVLYTAGRLESAATHDPLWNAAQHQLLHEGRIHNYLRMLWGKKILEWSASPQAAAEIMIALNDRYALDGRDPNSYSGIFWCLGRFDRPWGPERPIFGTVRYMSSANTLRKVRAREYLARFAE